MSRCDRRHFAHCVVIDVGERLVEQITDVAGFRLALLQQQQQHSTILTRTETSLCGVLYLASYVIAGRLVTPLGRLHLARALLGVFRQLTRRLAHLAIERLLRRRECHRLA